jgi:hypothetical protein
MWVSFQFTSDTQHCWVVVLKLNFWVFLSLNLIQNDVKMILFSKPHKLSKLPKELQNKQNYNVFLFFLSFWKFKSRKIHVLWKKKCVVYPQEDFLFMLKYIIGLLDSWKLIKTKIIINKYVKFLKKSFPTEFADPTLNHNKKAWIPNLKLARNHFF